MSNNWITDNLDRGGTFLRPSGILIALIFLLLVMGCSNDQTLEEFFHKEMKNNVEEYPEEVNYSYSLIHQVQNIFQKDDAIAILCRVGVTSQMVCYGRYTIYIFRSY